MPEAPEVEVVVRAIRPALVGARVDAVKVLHRAFTLQDRFPAGLTVRSVHRHGKWIVVGTNGPAVLLHLGMSGTFVVGGPTRTHARWIAMIDGPAGRHMLQFVDPRCFGRVRVLDAASTRAVLRPGATTRGCPELDLGPDVLCRMMRGSRAEACWRARLLSEPGELKPALLRQHVVAGLGNIYAAEACWIARANPWLSPSLLTRKQVRAIAGLLPELLARSLRLGGTSLGDANTFRGAHGQTGRARSILRVYGQQVCTRCRTPIAHAEQRGRTTWWCPRCQPNEEAA